MDDALNSGTEYVVFASLSNYRAMMAILSSSPKMAEKEIRSLIDCGANIWEDSPGGFAPDELWKEGYKIDCVVNKAKYSQTIGFLADFDYLGPDAI